MGAAPQQDAKSPGPLDALLVVDVQRDFLPGGALAIPRGDEIIPVLNRYLRLFEASGLPIFASRDWHPPDHLSFQQQGGPWPIHCVRDSQGARFAPELELPESTHVIAKATAPNRESYSAFAGTDLDEQLRALRVVRLFVGGLASEYCVLQSVRDALALGYAVTLLRDAIRPLDAKVGDGQRAVDEMLRLGAAAVEWDELASERPIEPRRKQTP